MQKAGAIKSVIDLINDENSSELLKEYASGALFAMIQDNCKRNIVQLLLLVASNKKVFSTDKGIEALIPLLSAAGDNMKANAAKAIWAACDNNTKNQDAAAAGLPALVTMLRSKNLSVQASAASAIWGLSQKHGKKLSFDFSHLSSKEPGCCS